MGDQIELEEGAPPWEPSLGAELRAEFRRWDVPLSGVVFSNGHNYLFECLSGEIEDTSLWAYVPVDGQNVSAPSQSILAMGRPMTLAVAQRGEGIKSAARAYVEDSELYWGESVVGKPDDVHHLLVELLEERSKATA